MAGIVRVGIENVEEVVAFLVREQAELERNIVYIGVEADGIAAELAELEPGWSLAAHGVRTDDGELVGIAFAEWDLELGRIWLHGPWVAGDDAQWDEWAAEFQIPFCKRDAYELAVVGAHAMRRQ